MTKLFNVVKKPKQTSPPPAPTAMESAAYLDVTYSVERAPFGPYPKQLATKIAKQHLPPKGRVLDMGCGRGEYLSAFADLGYDVAGVDISPSAPSLAENFDVRVANLDQEDMPFDAESFDVVFSKSVIEHTRTPQVLIQKAFDALAPGGTAVIMTPSWMHTHWGPFYCDHTHVTPFTKTALEDIMFLTGFEKIQVDYLTQLPWLWQNPWAGPLVSLVRKLPIAYRPMHDAPWSNDINKFIRFANELMLVAVAKKPNLVKNEVKP